MNYAIALPRLLPLVRIVLATLLVSLFAKVAIYLPFTPIPVIVQHIALLTCALHMGRREGVSVALLLLTQGALGLPVFSSGGGLLYFLGPKGGYLIGYVLGAYLTGWVGERLPKRVGSSFLALAAGLIPIYALGLLHLSAFTGFSSLLSLGFTPFFLPDLLKCAVAASLFHRWR